MKDNSSADDHTHEAPDGLGLRGVDQRRHDHRRIRGRKGRERRRGDRRRAGMRTLLLTAAALSSPHAAKVRAQPWFSAPSTSSSSIDAGKLPGVSVSIDSFNPIDPQHAYDDIISEAAEKYDLDPNMIRAVVQAESAFDAMAISPVGAVGLMQLMPALASELGVIDPMDPRQNIMAGAQYLRQLLDSHRGNVRLALASYNAGPGNVAKYRAIPPFKETQNYVKKVTALLADAKAAANH